ncbi:MAG: dTDP-4-dehydrorhamnose 3,5-epimerase [Syntrophales bacterium]|jgi:dTDP-4-dehydrorhamnose 3,5-epimerase|nr:dTDP-4-dehydrorhamnose 3,5-epimerase [Syntrophales bacterium]MDX9922906.1 dTDP-4-dehydrorhamnose 3,5-epimerase [Syntrophales bacterium]
MRVERFDIPGLILVTPDIFRDGRGFFLETFQRDRYEEAGIPGSLVQDNLSFSRRGVLRGLHYQWPRPQGKLVQCLRGEVLDVVADIRRGSPAFGTWSSFVLTGETAGQLYIPAGCAHGFLVLSDDAHFVYKCTDFYTPETERGIAWNDPDLAIDWSLKGTLPLLSDKDLLLPTLQSISLEHLPVYQELSKP